MNDRQDATTVLESPTKVSEPVVRYSGISMADEYPLTTTFRTDPLVAPELVSTTRVLAQSSSLVRA